MDSLKDHFKYPRGAVAVAVSATVLGLSFAGCGRDDSKHVSASASSQGSKLEWIQSRANDTNYAYLEDRDLNDSFLLGLSVIKVDDFISSALNMSVPPQTVRLRLHEDARPDQRLVVESADGQKIFAFGAEKQTNAALGAKWEIDFASSGNDLELRQLVDLVGGVFTASRMDGYWLSEGAPKVLNVSQDNDTVVVDLLHTVSQVILKKDASGNLGIGERISATPGRVTVRLWLKRTSSLPELQGVRSVGEAAALNLGYFGSVMEFGKEGEANPIQRIAMPNGTDQPSTTFYLKDFPLKYIAMAQRAVASWNTAFGYEAVRAEVAPAGIDAGDPRFFVIKWFDDTKDIGWAGIAKMFVEPGSGLALGGAIYIQGSTLLRAYSEIVDYTVSSNPPKVSLPAAALEGRLGALALVEEQGETPIIPYFANVGSNFEEYMQGYYYETIAHEVGHVLGLRHNFRGSTRVDDNGYSASVMDYLPRSHRSDDRGPGPYDIAAIRWGYFGETPTEKLAYCSDEHLWEYWDCNQSDLGDPMSYIVRGLTDGVAQLTRNPIAITHQFVISPLPALLEQAVKLIKLRSQLSPADQVRLATELLPAMDYLFSAEPATTLTDEESEVVSNNLELVKELGKRQLAILRAEGKI